MKTNRKKETERETGGEGGKERGKCTIECEKEETRNITLKSSFHFFQNVIEARLK